MIGWERLAYSGTKTRRREDRREIRNLLGTSGREAPDLYDALRSAYFLDRIVSNASAGRFSIVVRDNHDAARLYFPNSALEVARRELDALEAERSA